MADEGTILWRLAELESDVKELDREKAELKDLNTLTEEVRGLRKALIVASLTVGTSAIAFTFSVIQIVPGG